MQCAASQSRVDWRFPRYNDIHFMNKLIIISSYTFQNAQVRDTRPRTVCSSLASPHSVPEGLVRVVCSPSHKARLAHAIEICLHETTVQTSSMLRYFK